MNEGDPERAVPHRAAGVIECALPDELLLHLPGSAVAITLNASARAVWELCDGRRSLAAIAADLAERFDTAAEEIPGAVRDVVRELVRLEVLEVSA